MEDEVPLGVSPVETGTPAPAGTAESAPAPVAEQPADESGEQDFVGLPPETQAKLQKRFGKLTARSKELEKSTREREARIQFLEAQLQSVPQERPQQRQQEQIQRPAREQFQSEEEFVAALDRWADGEVEQRTAYRSNEMQQRQQYESAQRNFGAAESKFAQEHADYNQVVKDPQKVYFTPVVRDVLYQLENGPEIAYHLGNNPDLGWKVASLPPFQLFIELGRIDARLQHAKSSKKPAVSAAPPPPPQVGSEPETVQKDPSKMSDKEFNEWSRKRVKNRKG